MINQEAGPRYHKRSHIVLIPVFAGFDALGQLEYYGGVTPVFTPCRSGSEVLHYFDNFPTAAVATRATRLREYLAKRIARGEIAPNDDLTLVGHSTGGLGIRMLLWELYPKRDDAKPILVDGSAPVKPADLLSLIHRVVFLSVPHWGTNIADWVQAEWIWRKALIEELRVLITGSQLVIADRIESAVSAQIESMFGKGFFRAVQDALDEANEYNGKHTDYRQAEAHKANEAHSPAHFNTQDREKEVEQLRKINDIEFRSYVTLWQTPVPVRFGEPSAGVGTDEALDLSGDEQGQHP